MDIDITPHLAETVKAERERLEWSHDDVKAEGGPSSPTMTKIESGSGLLSLSSARKLEVAFDWKRGSVRKVAAGAEPARLGVTLEPGPGAAVEVSSLFMAGLRHAYEHVQFGDVNDRLTHIIGLLETALTANDETKLANILTARVALEQIAVEPHPDGQG